MIAGKWSFFRSGDPDYNSEKSKLRKRLSFHTGGGSFKRKVCDDLTGRQKVQTLLTLCTCRPEGLIFLNFLILQADLLELPALTKKVKTEADEDYFSSTENLLEVCTELHSYNNDILDKYNCAKLPQ